MTKEEIKQEVDDLKNKLNQIDTNINALKEEKLKVVGEFRYLKKMAEKEGIKLDASGEIIED